MKYLLLILHNPESSAIVNGRFDDMMAEHRVVGDELIDRGDLVHTGRLDEPTATKTVVVRDGVPTVTDGPYAESKEQLAGYYVIECDTEQEALDVASRIPDARYNAVEVRPVLESFTRGEDTVIWPKPE